MAQVFADMIGKWWSRRYIPQWKQKSKWSKETIRSLVRNRKEGELVWPVDDSVKRCEYKVHWIVEIFTKDDVRPARCATSENQNGTWSAEPACREFSASILRWCFRGRKQSRRCSRHFKSATKTIRQRIMTLETEKNYEDYRILSSCHIYKILQNGSKWLKPLPTWSGKDEVANTFHNETRNRSGQKNHFDLWCKALKKAN